MSAAPSFETWVREIGRAGLSWPENLVARRSVDSTNLLARRIVDTLAVEDESPRPTLVLAWVQTAGRGRLGRRWESAAGHGVYATVVWPLEERGALPTLPIAVAVALCERLGGFLPRPCRLDWPNDLVAGGRKLGGILIESVTRAERTVALIGFGINLTQSGVELPAGATSLREEGAPATASAVLGAVTTGLAERLANIQTDGDMLRRYRELSALTLGAQISCRVGEEVLTGRFAGFDDSGFLQLETASGRRTMSAGEVVE